MTDNLRMLVCIFGKRGAGKTHLIRNTSLKYCQKPVVIIDVLGNFMDFKERGAFVTESTSEGLEAIAKYKSWQEASQAERRLMDEPPDTIVICPMDESECANYVSAMLWECWDATLVLDEADSINMAKAPMYQYIIKYGRNHRIHVLTGCRRPAEISRNITAGANSIYIFQTQEHRDIEYFEKTILGREQAQRLKSMPEYHGIFIDYDKKSIGDFKTDKNGEVLILSEKSVV